MEPVVLLLAEAQVESTLETVDLLPVVQVLRV
jgi:hypothetical protein